MLTHTKGDVSMKSQTLFRLSGWAVIAGAVLKTIEYIFQIRSDDPIELYTNAQLWLFPIGFIGTLLFLIGLPGLYANQAERAGKFGLASFVLLFLGYTALEAGSQPVFEILLPFFATDPASQLLIASGGALESYTPLWAWFMPSLILANLGGLLYGIATIRARVYSHWAGWLMVLGVPGLFLLGDAIGMTIMMAGYIWCGFTLTGTKRLNTGKIEPAAQSA